MADTVNVRDVRTQYLALDDSPAKLRDVRLQYAEDSAQAGAIRRLHGQVLIIAKDSARVRDVRVQSVEDYAKAAGIRRLTAQVMIRPRDPVNVRDVRIQYLEIDNSHPDFSNDAWTRLLYVANARNGWNFTKDQVTPGIPESHNVQGMWNSRVKITAQPSSGFSGSMYLYYQRYPIDTRFKEIGHPFMDLTGKTSVKDVLPELNSWFRMALTLNDVEDSPIVNGKFTLTVKEGSWYFLPGTTYKFINLPDLTTMYPNTKLNGFEGGITVGGVKAAVGAPSGIYPVMLDDGTLVDAYVDMETDGGFWIQVADWTGSVPAGSNLTYGSALRKGQTFNSYTVDAVNSPVVPAGRLTNRGTEWMFKSPNANWIALYGTYQIGKAFDATKESVGPAETIPVRTPLGDKVFYGPRTGWGESTAMTHDFGFWTQQGAGGPCGGAGRAGPVRSCPISTVGNLWGNHCDLSSRKKFFVRATNYMGK